ncbi:MAG: EAL domain-containing protein [Gammaproteobacteria bacterium]
MILIVAESESTAKGIESHLRNAGHAIRAAWVADLEDLEDALERSSCDLLICSATGQSPSLRNVLKLRQRFNPDLPVLLLASRGKLEAVSSAIEEGAQDLISQDDPEQLRHLEQVCLREIRVSQQLRELRRTRARLADFESRHQQLLAGTNDAVAHIQEGILSHANPAFAALLGRTDPASLIGTPIMDLVDPDHQGMVKEQLRRLAKGKHDGKPLECLLRKEGGGTVAISAQLTPGTVDGENFVEMLIRAELRAAEPAPAAATPAPARSVTPAPPAPRPTAAAPAAAPAAAAPTLGARPAFIKAVPEAIALSAKSPRSVLFLTVDDFTGLETRLGVGDTEEIMERLAAWTRGRLTAQDQLYRFSTGELAAIIARPAIVDVEKLCELICSKAAEQIFTTAHHEATLSVTVAAYPLAGNEQAAAVINEIALEARNLSAKGGRQSVVLGPTAKSSALEREEAVKAAVIKKAIEDNRLKLAYQSIASLEGDPRQHFDLLVRLVDETGKELRAAEFIQVAEKYGLMKALDRWVTAKAMSTQAKRASSEEASSLFVKLSEDTLKDAEAFIAWLQAAVSKRPLRPDELVFAFHEDTLQNHIRKAKLLTQAISKAGGLLAIEYFGLGSNSVQLLEHVTVNYLKFHPSFTHEFNNKEKLRRMTDLIETAKQRKIKTIVSHVEDANVMARLWQMGVNYIQGYHVQEPEVVRLSAEVARA